MKKINHLEGIRGIGALIVYMCHLQIVFVATWPHNFFIILNRHLPHNVSGFIVSLSNLMILGNMFLHIFWALSAYVIFRKFFAYDIKENQLLSNSVKRYVRLMFPCAVSIFFTYILYQLGYIYVTQIPLKELKENLFLVPPSFLHALKTSVWNTFFNFDYYTAYNGPLWTIQREFFGSLFCFGLFGLTGKFNNRSLIYVAVFTVVFILKMCWLNSFLFGYFLCDMDVSSQKETNIFIKKVEAANKYLIKHQSLSLILFMLIFIAGRMVIYKFLPLMDLINCFLCLLVIFVSLRSELITRIMGFKIFTFFGKLSFGLYLLHWPIICSLSSWLYLRYNLTSNIQLAALFSITTVVCLIMSWFFYKYIDIQSIAVANKISSYVETVTTYPNMPDEHFELRKQA